MVKTLMKSIREYRKESIQAMVYVTIEVILEVIIPFLMADLIDKGIDNGDMPYIIKIGLTLVIAGAISLLFGVLAGARAAKASAGFAKNLRKDIYYNVQRFSFFNIDKFSPASLVTRLTTDITNVQMAYMMIIRLAVRAPFMIIFALIASILIDWQLSLIFAACIPFMAIALVAIIRTSHPIFEKVFRTYDKLNNVTQENLHGVREVKAFVREEYEDKKFAGISQRIFELFSRAEKIMAFNMPTIQFCAYACILLLSWFGARMIVSCGGDASTGLSTGELISLITYAMQILMALMALGMVLVMITIAQTSSERIVEVLREKSDLDNPENPLYDVPNGEIIFKNVNFSYLKRKDKLALKDINLTIHSGETVGILGGTGSSKSSLVQLIPRLYDVTEGEVIVGGHDVRAYDIETLRDAVAMVLQKNILFSGSIRENLKWGNENATDEQIRHVCDLAQASEFIEGFPDGYDTHIEQGGSNVSGGQKQRLCIARALLKKPKILILDDSTSAVDTKTDAMIRRAFREEIPDTTKLIIAQRISSVQDADKIIVLDEGRICDVGTHEELLKRCTIYQEVYESQTKGDDADE